ncbi:MAG: TetR family transcriptional regulator [Hyphomonadaceae bacterium]|nr:MAG: TetR family transcriptional regulator [Hyphomonadaceae bacterium]KAF0187192.1 MAG: TetR family transcriptional regulator [Hyphomonadaceae bacterium]
MRTVNPQKVEIRKREIVEAAKICFEQRGFHSTTMAEICAKASISPGALYRYFDSKESIIAAMAEDDQFRAMQSFKSALSEIQNGADFFQTMDKLLDDVVTNYCTKEQGAMAAELISEAMRNPIFAESCSRAYMDLHSHFCAILECGQKLRHIDESLNIAEAATMIMASVDGMVLRMAFCGDVSNIEASRWLKNFCQRYLSPKSQTQSQIKNRA